MPEISEYPAAKITATVSSDHPAVPPTTYKSPPGVTVRLDPGDDDNGLDIEVTVRSNLESPETMLGRSLRALTEALRGGDDD